MIFMLNCKIKSQVRQNFSSAACSYNRWAEAQRKSADRLVALLPQVDYRDILDLGCGTGFLIQSVLHSRTPKTVTGIDFAPKMVEHCRRFWPNHRFICADIENVDLSGAYDLIVSNFSFQWIKDIPSTLRKYIFYLRSGGILAVAFPVCGSLEEIVRSARKANVRPPNLLEFPDPAPFFEAFTGRDSRLLISRLEKVSCHFDQPLRAFKSIKAIGASFSNGSAYNTAEMRKLLKVYGETFGRQIEGYPLTYKVLFLIIQKK
jgi:malonyl-CoA O-methyltransferase